MNLDGYQPKSQPWKSSPHGIPMSNSKWFWNRLHHIHNHLQGRLEQNESLACEAVLNDGSKISANTFSFYFPDMILMGGYDENGNTVELIAHQHSFQIKFTLIKEPKQESQTVRFYDIYSRKYAKD